MTYHFEFRLGPAGGARTPKRASGDRCKFDMFEQLLSEEASKTMHSPQTASLFNMGV